MIPLHGMPVVPEVNELVVKRMHHPHFDDQPPCGKIVTNNWIRNRLSAISAKVGNLNKAVHRIDYRCQQILILAIRLLAKPSIITPQWIVYPVQTVST